jgi:tetratricopeptide (TPR) repeat protein
MKTDQKDMVALSLVNEKLINIQKLIDKGDFATAKKEAKELSKNPKAHLPARAFEALAGALNNEPKEAVQILATLPKAAILTHAALSFTIGSAWFRCGAINEGIAYLRRCVELDKNHILAQARLGACLLASEQPEEALPYLQAAHKAMPTSGGAGLNLARANLMLGNYAEANEILVKIQNKDDMDKNLYEQTLIETLFGLGENEKAQEILRAACENGTEESVARAVSLLSQKALHDEAEKTLIDAMEKYPESVPLMSLAAEIAQVRGRYAQAGKWLRKALEKDENNSSLWAQLATLSGKRISVEDASEACEKALELTKDMKGPQRAEALCAKAHVLEEDEKHVEAEKFYREALQTAPKFVRAMNGLGHLLVQLGRVDEAVKIFEELKEIAPLQGWSQLIHARTIPEDPKVLEQMEKAALRPSMEGPVRTHLLYTLAAAYDKKKEYDKAWELAAKANEATKTLLPYSPQAHRKRAEREMAQFSSAFMESRKGYGSPSEVPVFILGMPRSGTTLVEQILGSHTQVFGAGELSQIGEMIQRLDAWEWKIGSRRGYPDCIDDMTQEESLKFAERLLVELQEFAPDAKRIVDKLPHNFEHVGLIKLLFPNAKILHLKREPKDVAISNYFIDYGAKFGGMGFAYDLEWIGEQLVDHQRFVDHWHAVFPDQILEVDYDSLVEDVDWWAHKIIDYINLDWEEGVLSFQELDRAVKTASSWQVRQPIYTTSKAKWKRFEKYLAPLDEAMKVVPEMPEPKPLSEVEAGLFIKGSSLVTAGKPQEAETVLRKLLESRPRHAAAHHFLGAALWAQGKASEALEFMRRSVRLHRGHRAWLENLEKLERACGNTEQADKILSVLAGKTNESEIITPHEDDLIEEQE